MQKRLAILGMLCLGLVGGAWSQVPGNGGKQHENSQDQQKTADLPKPVVVIESTKGAPNQEHASEKSSQYPWRELLAPANVPNWFLVIVGGVTGLFVYKTLKSINRQADLMKEQSDLTVEKERAKLRFDLDAFDPESSKAAIGYNLKGTVSIFGSTEAFIEKTVFFAGILREGEGEIEILPAPMAEFPNVIRSGSDPLKTWTVLFRTNPMRLWVPTVNEGIDDVLSGKSLMFCKGLINYSDVFNGKWVFRFSRCYNVYLLPDGECAGGYWEDYGDPKDNGEYKAN
jgi:hypothetical protein